MQAGVSTNQLCIGTVLMPRIVCRVVCGRFDVMAIFSPTSALVSVDLPVLGRPTHTKPERNCSSASGIDRLPTAIGPDDQRRRRNLCQRRRPLVVVGTSDEDGRLESVAPLDGAVATATCSALASRTSARLEPRHRCARQIAHCRPEPACARPIAPRARVTSFASSASSGAIVDPPFPPDLSCLSCLSCRSLPFAGRFVVGLLGLDARHHDQK